MPSRKSARGSGSGPGNVTARGTGSETGRMTEATASLTAQGAPLLLLHMTGIGRERRTETGRGSGKGAGTGTLMSAACAIAGGSLTPEEVRNGCPTHQALSPSAPLSPGLCQRRCAFCVSAHLFLRPSCRGSRYRFGFHSGCCMTHKTSCIPLSQSAIRTARLAPHLLPLRHCLLASSCSCI